MQNWEERYQSEIEKSLEQTDGSLGRFSSYTQYKRGSRYVIQHTQVECVAFEEHYDMLQFCEITYLFWTYF